MTDDALRTLISAAIAASKHTYSPYSHYPVGAALQTPSGLIYGGCNIENASYPVTICAERTALVKAVSEGERAFTRIAVVTRNGGFPCGMCRQMLYEFAPHLEVIIADLDGNILEQKKLNEILAYGFGPEKLGH